MRVMLMGIRGEVGRTLGASLVARGHTVLGVSTRPVLQADAVLSLAEATAALRGGEVDLLVNCSGRGDRRVVERSGLDATAVLAPVLAERRIPAVLISTARVFEGYSGEIADDAPPRARTDYALANAEHERLWLELAGPSAHVLRMTNYFAPPETLTSPQASLLPWSLVTEALETDHIIVRSAEEVSKEFVSAGDVASAVELLVTAPDAPRICATTPGAVISLAALVGACQGAFADCGLEVPAASFGTDANAGMSLRPGWLAQQGWAGGLDESTIRRSVAGWLREVAAH